VLTRFAKEWVEWMGWLNVACSTSRVGQLAYQLIPSSRQLEPLMRLESLKDATGQYRASAHEPIPETKFTVSSGL
jgi:hypothetical protein